MPKVITQHGWTEFRMRLSELATMDVLDALDRTGDDWCSELEAAHAQGQPYILEAEHAEDGHPHKIPLLREWFMDTD